MTTPSNIIYLAKMKSDKELSSMLDLIRAQAMTAYETRNTKALEDLQKREAEVIEARIRKMELN